MQKAGHDIKCAACGRLFYGQLCKIKEGKAKYCSRACVSGGKSAEVKCAWCSISLRMENNRINRVKDIFCSQRCHYESIRGVSKPFNGPVKKGDQHPFWKGERVGYRGLHAWLYRAYGRPSKCTVCSTEGKCHWANIDGVYSRERKRWASMCPSCHFKYDWGRKKGGVPLIA